MIQHMKTRQQAVQEEIDRIKSEIVSLGHIHPGSLSMQKRSRGGEYWHLSYSHAGKGHTEYIRKDDLSDVREELEDYRRFRELISKWIGLEIELGKIRRKSRGRSKKSGQSS